MSPVSVFIDRMALLRQSDTYEAHCISVRFAGRLIAFIRQQLDLRLHGKVNPEYIILSVFTSFFCIQRDDRVRFSEGNVFWSLLIVLALRKLGHNYYRATPYCKSCWC